VTAPADGLPARDNLVGGRGVPAIGDPGRAAREMGAGPPPEIPAVADHVLSEYSTDSLEIRAASVRGLMHRYQREPRQDAFSVVHEPATGTTIVVVCDGVGSLPRSHEAAAYVVDRLPMHYWTHRNLDTAVKAVNSGLQELAAQAVSGLGPDDDPDDHGMATTLVAVAIVPGADGRVAHIVRSDDSTVWHLGPDRTWSMKSVDADPDVAVHTGSVRALPAAAPRLHHVDITFDGGALFVMTDGVGKPLEHSAGVRAALGSWWSSPPTIFEFGREVGFASKTHMDDRTVVGVWVRPAADVAERPG
jgi:hypothetical protein